MHHVLHLPIDTHSFSLFRFFVVHFLLHFFCISVSITFITILLFAYSSFPVLYITCHQLFFCKQVFFIIFFINYCMDIIVTKIINYSKDLQWFAFKTFKAFSFSQTLSSVYWVFSTKTHSFVSDMQ